MILEITPKEYKAWKNNDSIELLDFTFSGNIEGTFEENGKYFAVIKNLTVEV